MGVWGQLLSQRAEDIDDGLQLDVRAERDPLAQQSTHPSLL